MKDTVEVLYFQKKESTTQLHGKVLHIQEATSDNQSNDKHAIFPDIIFDTSLKKLTPLITFNYLPSDTLLPTSPIHHSTLPNYRPTPPSFSRLTAFTTVHSSEQLPTTHSTPQYNFYACVN